MATYEGENVAAQAWRVVAEHRGRKGLRKTWPLVMDPRVTPKSSRGKFPDN